MHLRTAICLQSFSTRAITSQLPSFSARALLCHSILGSKDLPPLLILRQLKPCIEVMTTFYFLVDRAFLQIPGKELKFNAKD